MKLASKSVQPVITDHQVVAVVAHEVGAGDHVPGQLVLHLKVELFVPRLLVGESMVVKLGGRKKGLAALMEPSVPPF